MSAIWNSYSKSEMARRPRMMTLAPTRFRSPRGARRRCPPRPGDCPVGLADDRHALLDGEEGLLLGVHQDRHPDAVEDGEAAVHDVEVAVRDRVERAREDGERTLRTLLLHSAPPSDVAARPVRSARAPVEAQDVVADAFLSRAGEGAYCLRKGPLVEVLRHHHTALREKRPLAEGGEQRLVEVAVVGRVEVHDVELHPLVAEGPDGRAGVLPEDLHLAPGGRQHPGVLLRRLDRRRAAVDEDDPRRPAGERLEAQPRRCRRRRREIGSRG